MRRTAWCLSMLVVTACSKSDTAADSAAADSAAAAAAPAMAPAAGINLADVAGTWSMRSVPESGDTTATVYELTATSDTTGWSLKFPSGPNVPLHVTVSGDSVMSRTDEYSSVRRAGTKVVTEGVLRLQGGRLVGTNVAHYRTSGPDSVLRLRTEGTRKP